MKSSKMKHTIICLLLLIASAVGALSQTATETAEAYLNYLKQDEQSRAVALIEQDASTEYRGLFKFVKALPVEEAKSIYQALFGALQINFDEVEVLGEVREGDDIAHILIRSRIRSGNQELESLRVISCRRIDGTWRVMLTGKSKVIAVQTHKALGARLKAGGVRYRNKPNRVPKTAWADESSKSVVKKLAKEMADATTSGNYAKVIDYTHPAVLKEAAGRKEAVERIETVYRQIKDAGYSVTKYEVGDPGDFHTQGDNTFVVVPTSMEMKSPVGRIIARSYLLGISSNRGKSWKFLDGSGLQDEESREKMLPKMPATLTLPEPGKPEIMKDK